MVHFPPFPTIPPAPAGGVDVRQRQFRHIAGALADQLLHGAAGGANVISGFRASAVDLGALQNVLNGGLSRRTMHDVRDRWDSDAGRWVSGVILAWVQRVKEMSFQLAELGVHVSLQTQDDHGSYLYQFDIFPGRTSPPGGGAPLI